MSEEQEEEQPQDAPEPSEEEGQEGDEDSQEGQDDKGDNKKLLLIVAGVVVLLIGTAVGLYFTGMLDGLLGKEEACVEVLDDHGVVIEGCPDEGDEDHGDDGHGGDSHGDEDHGGGHGGDGHGGGGATNFLALPPMIVNLNSDDDGTPRYLRLTVQLEMNKASDVGKIESLMPRVVDQFQTYLRELRVKDLRGSAGIYRLQTELLWRVNQAAHPIKVKDVLFQEILIQ